MSESIILLILQQLCEAVSVQVKGSKIKKKILPLKATATNKTRAFAMKSEKHDRNKERTNKKKFRHTIRGENTAKAELMLCLQFRFVTRHFLFSCVFGWRFCCSFYIFESVIMKSVFARNSLYYYIYTFDIVVTTHRIHLLAGSGCVCFCLSLALNIFGVFLFI